MEKQNLFEEVVEILIRHSRPQSRSGDYQNTFG
jgi:hypothetical protein